MKIGIVFLLFLFCGDSTMESQVIYERTFLPVSSYLQQTIQLSDTSSISFGRTSECAFSEFLHIDKNGNNINSIGFSLESSHYSGARIVGLDSVLVWTREGPTDSDGPNYLQIGLWTPTQFVTLVSDSLYYRFGEDQDIPYDAYLFKEDKLVYRKADSLYVMQISTQQILHKVIVPKLGNVNAFLDYIVAFPNSADPIIFSIDLLPVDTWHLNQHPVNHYVQMALDSFLIGHITQEAASLHVVNGLTEVSFDLDLSSYLTHIDDIQVNQQGLFIKGKRGALDYLIQINEQLQVINETVMDMPELDGLFTFTYYSDRMYASTTDGISQYEGEYMMSYHYPEANPIRFVDVSLDTIWVDSVYFWPHEMHLPARVFLLAKMTNNSQDTIHSLTYHFESPPEIFCDPGVYPEYVEGLTVPPNAIGVFPIITSSWEIAENKPLVRTYYVEHANYHLDDHIDDNYFQLSYLLSGIQPVQENSISIWPNPFEDFLESSKDVKSLRMYNRVGQLVGSGSNRLENLSSLATGIYYVLGIKNAKSFYSTVLKIE